MGAALDIRFEPTMWRGISINTDSAAITVVPSDSGVIFVNKYTTGNCTYTLPTAANSAGKIFWFFNAQTAYAIVISDPSSADVMFVGDDTAADTATSPAETGHWCAVTSDGTSFYVLCGPVAWTAA
jgi:hypothetical protein